MSNLMDVMGSSKKMDWRTPEWLFRRVLDEFPISLDICAHRENAMCRYFISKQLDAFSIPMWRRPDVVNDLHRGGVSVENERLHLYAWMNPPYGRHIGAWVQMADTQCRRGVTVVALLPARTDTRWWWKHIRHHEVRFLPGRLKFGGSKAGAPFPSAIVVFRGSPHSAETIYWDIKQ